MINSGIEIKYCNWKPLLFTAILLASKFWEDINFWNVDYVDALAIYNLKSINRMESEFVSLCESTRTTQKTFNRFKDPA